MLSYNTKQREMLLHYFAEHIDESFSAQELAQAFAEDEISISAIYRNLSALEKDGKLQRIDRKHSRKTYYRYNAFDTCKDCLHLSCKKCGKTFHLNHTGAIQIMDTLSNTENFALDKSNTILYGICGNCNRKQTDKKET